MENQFLTETQIENRVEAAIDRLDRHFMSNQITQEQYDRDMLSLDKWAEQEYQHSKHAGKLWNLHYAQSRVFGLSRVMPLGTNTTGQHLGIVNKTHNYIFIVNLGFVPIA